jgi:hypothetical protein
MAKVWSGTMTVVDRFAPNNCDHNARTAEEEGEDDKGDSFCRPSDQANTMTTVTSAATVVNNPRTNGVRHCEIARRVAAFWDPQDDWFLFSLRSEIVLQFPAQQSGLRSNNIILCRVVIWRPLEDPLANSLFANFVEAIFQRAATDVQQKVL